MRSAHLIAFVACLPLCACGLMRSHYTRPEARSAGNGAHAVENGKASLDLWWEALRRFRSQRTSLREALRAIQRLGALPRLHTARRASKRISP